MSRWRSIDKRIRRHLRRRGRLSTPCRCPQTVAAHTCGCVADRLTEYDVMTPDGRNKLKAHPERYFLRPAPIGVVWEAYAQFWLCRRCLGLLPFGVELITGPGA